MEALKAINIYGMCENGMTCIFDLPEKYYSLSDFENRITGYNDKPWQREELQGQPILKGYNGPMFNGYAKRNGETIVVIRYEI